MLLSVVNSLVLEVVEGLLSSIFYWWDQEANGGGGSLTEGSIDRLKILKTCSAGSPTLGDTS